MTNDEKHQQRLDYFDTRYVKITHYWFKTEGRMLLRDHLDDADRTCRFCDQRAPAVGFADLTHAVPDFLGNLSIISLNECDHCNEYFGKSCEDHLSKATMLHRTLSAVPRKKGPKSTFKSSDESLRIDASGAKVDLRVPAPNSVDDLMVDGQLPDSIPSLGTRDRSPTSPSKRRWLW